MKQTILLYLMVLSTICLSQTNPAGIHRINNEYQIDTNVVLENLNLSRLVSEMQLEKIKEYKSKEKTPLIILNFLKVVCDSNFTLANPKEDWNFGCVENKKLADRQLQVVGLSNDFCILAYKSGGRGVFRHLLIFKLKGNEIVDFWTGIGSDDNTIKGILKYITDNIGVRRYRVNADGTKETGHYVLNGNCIYF